MYLRHDSESASTCTGHGHATAQIPSTSSTPGLRPATPPILPTSGLLPGRKFFNHILTWMSSRLDLLHFAYQAGRGVKDVKAFIIDTIHKHLELPKTAQFPSAFNTLQPHILAQRLLENFTLDNQLILWRVQINKNLSGFLTTSLSNPGDVCSHHNLTSSTLTRAGPHIQTGEVC